MAAVQAVGGSRWLVHLEAPAVAPQVRPGHFLLVRCTDPRYPAYDPFLPRAYFVFAVDRQAGRMSLLVEERGRGSAWLASRRQGDPVLVHGPIGREITPARLTRNLLLLAEGPTGVAGLALLGTEAGSAGRSVTLIENAADGAGLPPALLAAEVEYRTTTPDGGGLLGALPALLGWADEVVIAAPGPLLDTLSALRRARLEPFSLYGNLPVQAIPLPDSTPHAGDAAPPGGGDAVPCGDGRCGACTVQTGRGPRLFCREGPAFPLETLRFEPDMLEAVAGT